MVVFKESDRSPNPIDVHVGLQVRFRRKALRMSQERLADTLGLTFQQVQKYERGANRISASKLYEIARSLQAPISWFFEGLADPTAEGGENEAEPRAPAHARDFLLSQEGLDLANLFSRLPQRRVRRRLIELIRTLADASEVDLLAEAEG